MEEYLKSIKVPRCEKVSRKPIKPRKLYLRWLNRSKTKSCSKEKEEYPVETYFTLEELGAAIKAELDRIAEARRRDRWFYDSDSDLFYDSDW